MRQALAVVFSSFVVSGSGSGALGQPVKFGGEFQVNAYTVGEQYQTSVAGDSAGDFVVVWTSNEEDGDRWGVFGQRYDSSGSLHGSPFQVNSYTTYHQYRSSAAMDADGDFVVAWASLEQDGDHSGIFVRRFDSSGTAQGVELQVNTYTTSSQNYPAVAHGRRRRLRRRLAEQWSGWLRSGHLRPTLRLDRTGAGGRVPGQLLHHRVPGTPRGGHGRRWRLRGGLAWRAAGRIESRNIWATLRCCGCSARRRVSGQQLHPQHPAHRVGSDGR